MKAIFFTMVFVCSSLANANNDLNLNQDLTLAYSTPKAERFVRLHVLGSSYSMRNKELFGANVLSLQSNNYDREVIALSSKELIQFNGNGFTASVSTTKPYLSFLYVVDYDNDSRWAGHTVLEPYGSHGSVRDTQIQIQGELLTATGVADVNLTNCRTIRIDQSMRLNAVGGCQYGMVVVRDTGEVKSGVGAVKVNVKTQELSVFQN